MSNSRYLLFLSKLTLIFVYKFKFYQRQGKAVANRKFAVSLQRYLGLCMNIAHHKIKNLVIQFLNMEQYRLILEIRGLASKHQVHQVRDGSKTFFFDHSVDHSGVLKKTCILKANKAALYVMVIYNK